MIAIHGIVGSAMTIALWFLMVNVVVVVGGEVLSIFSERCDS